jgi:hypothetical protein
MVIKSRRLKWAEYVAGMEECRSTCEILVGKPTRNRLLGRPICRWENNIRMHLNPSSGYFPYHLTLPK